LVFFCFLYYETAVFLLYNDQTMISENEEKKTKK